MKLKPSYLFVLLLLYTSIPAIKAQNTATQSWDAASQDFNDDKKHPPIPEPATYGLIMVGTALLFVGCYQFKRKEKYGR